MKNTSASGGKRPPTQTFASLAGVVRLIAGLVVPGISKLAGFSQFAK
jgi:hypothetical protein